jgi:hypothetical protein
MYRSFTLPAYFFVNKLGREKGAIMKRTVSSYSNQYCSEECVPPRPLPINFNLGIPKAVSQRIELGTTPFPIPAHTKGKTKTRKF